MITYEKIFSILNSKFELVMGKQKNYFLDYEQRIVATIDKNSITMFYDFPEESREIWNHYGKVAITFVKNFNVNGQICDVLCINGLCGAANDIIIDENFSIDRTNNIEMRNLLHNDKKSLQQQFEDLGYGKRILILKKLIGANFKGARIDDIQLFESSEEYMLGNCGYLSSNDGVASFDIGGIVKFNNMVTNRIYKDGYDINIINFKSIYQKVNYGEVYDFYRRKNDWYYNAGYKTAGSLETRNFTERRKTSTVDVDSIHISKYMLDIIYNNRSKSLNAKRLQMIYILNLLLNDKKKSEDYISSSYNFSVRNCDIIKQKVKR